MDPPDPLTSASRSIRELRRVQSERGHLTDETLRELSERLGVPLYELEGLASFYPHFRRTRPPRVHVTVCRDLSCWMRGADAHLDALRAATSGMDDVEIEAVSCLGHCDIAPACMVGELPVPAADAARHLDSAAGAPAEPAQEVASEPRRWHLDPYREAPASRYAVLREAARAADPEAVIARLTDSGLRGLGGAGFQTGRKWALVRAEPAARKFVICNADESEPGTFKDRVILEELPHLVIEGMVLAALCIGAEQCIVYIRHEYGGARRSLERALEEARAAGIVGSNAAGSGRPVDVEVFVSPGGYVLGEETALLEALEGRRGEPRNKPPYPGVRGLFGLPTLINNVETLAAVPRALRTGRADLKLFSVSGDVVRPGVHELALGTPLRELVERCGGVAGGREIAAFLPGGASTGFLPGSRADVALDWDPLHEAGSALGSGAVVVLAEGRDLPAAARNLVAFFRNESCGKCVPCRIGTEKAVALLDAQGLARSEAPLRALHDALAETSICGLGQVALVPAISLLDQRLGRAEGDQRLGQAEGDQRLGRAEGDQGLGRAEGDQGLGAVERGREDV